MAELCFNTFNRSAYLVEDPDLPTQIAAAAAAGFTWFGPDTFSLAAWEASGRSLLELADLLDAHGLRVWEIAAFDLGTRETTLAQAELIAAQACVLRPQYILTNVGAPIDDERLDLFDEVCQLFEAQGAGVRPAIEYLPFTPANSIATTLPLIDHVGRERLRGRGKRIYGRINAKLRDRAIEHDGGIEVGKGVRRRRVGEIVGGHVDGLHGGDGAFFRRGDALLQQAHLVGECRLVADRRG